MNLQTKIDERLWQMVQSSYEGRNFTGAILDSIYFLSDLIREKSGLASDGVQLINQAFGGNTPKLKINSLQSESEKNIQAGIAQILRGIYQSIRNPRSHEKWNDSKENAISIILFINYLIQIIDKSKSPFTKPEFIERVFDNSFVKKERYAALLVSEIPKKQKLDVFFDVYRNKMTGDSINLKFFMKALLDSFNEDEMKKVYEAVSDELKITDDEKVMICILQIIPPELLEHLEEISRLRLESKLIDSIKSGAYSNAVNRCMSGAFGTWARKRCKYFLLKDDLINAILGKLSSKKESEYEYIFNYFFGELLELVAPPSKKMVAIINSKLTAGNKRFYDVMSWYYSFMSDEWKSFFKEAFDNFQEVKPTPNDDDIPF